MAKATHCITDHADFEGIVWETKIGRIITMKGNINPQMGFTVRDVETGEDIVSSNMVEVLADILPFEMLDKNKI